MIQREYSCSGRAGCVELRRSRQSGTVIGIYVAEQAGMDPDGGPWVTICEEHGSLVNHRTLQLARDHRADPQGWCEECRES